MKFDLGKFLMKLDGASIGSLNSNYNYSRMCDILKSAKKELFNEEVLCVGEIKKDIDEIVIRGISFKKIDNSGD